MTHGTPTHSLLAADILLSAYFLFPGQIGRMGRTPIYMKINNINSFT